MKQNTQGIHWNINSVICWAFSVGSAMWSYTYSSNLHFYCKVICNHTPSLRFIYARYNPPSLFTCRHWLTNWGRDKMAAFSQTTFSNAFSLIKMFEFRLQFQLKYVPKGPINNIPTLFQIMAWCRSGDKLLSESMLVSLPTHICVTRPQWVNNVLYRIQGRLDHKLAHWWLQSNMFIPHSFTAYHFMWLRSKWPSIKFFSVDVLVSFVIHHK